MDSSPHSDSPFQSPNAADKPPAAYGTQTQTARRWTDLDRYMDRVDRILNDYEESKRVHPISK